jgi:hypothetical protein
MSFFFFNGEVSKILAHKSINIHTMDDINTRIRYDMSL